jgi:hypothetical protein
MPTQLGTHVPNAHTHISMAPHVRAIMRLQEVQTCIYSVATVPCQHYEPLAWYRYNAK